MANTEKESLSISELLKMREKISEVIVDTIAGFISHPRTLILCSGIICYTMHQSGYGVLAILTFIFGMWCICPVLGWIIRSDNSVVHDTLVIKSNKIEDFTSKNPIMCVKHYINSFKVEHTTSPKVCGE